MDRVVNFYDALVSNRKGMLQFGLAMMLVGLWIIWWRK